jgi:hypothetical protein
MSGPVHEFCDHCPLCRPGLIDQTGRVMPDDSPIMVIINRIWNRESTYAERKAFIDITLHNRHTTDNLRLAGGLMEKISRAANQSV